MEQFINFYCKVKGKLIMSQELAETLASLCLPLFFNPSFPKEKYSWDVVEGYAPFIFLQQKDKVNKAIYKYLNKNHPEAWFKEAFNTTTKQTFPSIVLDSEQTNSKVLVDFEKVDRFVGIMTGWMEVNVPSLKADLENFDRFWNKLSQSSSFAHKAHKELKKINS